MTTNYTKQPQIIPNERKIFQMVIKYKFSILLKALQNLYPDWDFCLENNPSGNPDPLQLVPMTTTQSGSPGLVLCELPERRHDQVFNVFRRQRGGDGHARLHCQKPDGILPQKWMIKSLEGYFLQFFTDFYKFCYNIFYNFFTIFYKVFYKFFYKFFLQIFYNFFTGANRKF
jgi:hypothetical protein